MEETRDQMMDKLNTQRTLVRELEEILILSSLLDVKDAIKFLANKYGELSHDLANAIQLVDCKHYLNTENEKVIQA